MRALTRPEPNPSIPTMIVNLALGNYWGLQQKLLVTESMRRFLGASRLDNNIVCSTCLPRLHGAPSTYTCPLHCCRQGHASTKLGLYSYMRLKHAEMGLKMQPLELSCICRLWAPCCVSKLPFSVRSTRGKATL